MLEPQSFDQWSAASAVAEPAKQLSGYSNYLRTTLFKNGTYTPEAEQSIRDHASRRAVADGVISTDVPEEADAALSALHAPQPNPDADAQFLLDHYSTDFPDTNADAQEKAAALRSYLTVKRMRPEGLANVAPLIEPLLADRAAIRAARISAVDRGDLQLVAVDEEDGRQIYTGRNTSHKTISDSLDSLVSTGAIDPTDLPQVQGLLASPNGGRSTIADNIRFGVFSNAVDDMARKDPMLRASLERRAENIRAMGDLQQKGIGEKAFDAAGQILAAPIEGIGEMVASAAGLAKPKPKPDSPLPLEPLLKRGYSEDEISRYTNDYLLAMSGPAYRPDKPETGIAVDSLGNPVLAPSLVPNKAKFAAALDASGLNPEQKKLAEANRAAQLTRLAPDFLRLILSKGPDAVSAYAAAKAKGATAEQFVQDWVSNSEQNYSWLGSRARQLTSSVVGAIADIPASIAALSGSATGANILVATQKDQAKRAEYARLMGDQYGTGFEILNAVPAMASLILATAGTEGAYLGLRTALRAGTKGVLRAAATNAASGLSGEAAALVRTAATAGGESAAGQALERAGLELAGKFAPVERMAPLFATSFVQSAGSAYGQIYDQLPEGMSHDDRHKAAFGYAMASGLSTAVLTTGMALMGHGGAEAEGARTLGDLFRGADGTVSVAGRPTRLADLTYKQHKFLSEQVLGYTLSDKHYQLMVRATLGHPIQQFLTKTFKGAMDEGVQEALDTAIAAKLQDAATGNDTPLAEQLNQIWNSFLIGGAMGGGVHAITESVTPLSESAKLQALDATRDLYSQTAARLRAAGSPATAEMVARLSDTARAEAAAQRAAEMAARAANARTSATTAPADNSDKPLDNGLADKPLQPTALVGDHIGQRASIKGYSGTLEDAGDGTVRLKLDTARKDGITHLSVGSRFSPIGYSGLAINRNALPTLGSDTGTIAKGTPYVVPDPKSKAAFALPADKGNVIEVPLGGGRRGLLVKGARMVGQENITRDVVLTDPDHIADAHKFYGTKPSEEQPVAGPLPLPLLASRAPVVAPVATSPAPAKKAGPSATVRKMIVKSLMAKGVSQEHANRFADKFGKQLSSIRKTEEMRDATLKLFSQIGGRFPTEVDIRPTTPEAWAPQSATAEEAAAHAENAKAHNARMADEANAANAKALNDAPESSEAAAELLKIIDCPALESLIVANDAGLTDAALDKAAAEITPEEHATLETALAVAEEHALALPDSEASVREDALSTLASLAALADEVKDRAIAPPEVPAEPTVGNAPQQEPPPAEKPTRKSKRGKKAPPVAEAPPVAVEPLPNGITQIGNTGNVFAISLGGDTSLVVLTPSAKGGRRAAILNVTPSRVRVIPSSVLTAEQEAQLRDGTLDTIPTDSGRLGGTAEAEHKMVTEALAKYAGFDVIAELESARKKVSEHPDKMAQLELMETALRRIGERIAQPAAPKGKVISRPITTIERTEAPPADPVADTHAEIGALLEKAAELENNRPDTTPLQTEADKSAAKAAAFEKAGATVPSKTKGKIAKIIARTITVRDEHAAQVAANNMAINAKLAELEKAPETPKEDLPEPDSATVTLEALILNPAPADATTTKAPKKRAPKVVASDGTLVFRTEHEQRMFDACVAGGHLVSDLTLLGFSTRAENGVPLYGKQKGGGYGMEFRRRLLAEVQARYPFVEMPEGTYFVKSNVPVSPMEGGKRELLPLPINVDADENPLTGVYTNDPVVTTHQLDKGLKIRIPKELRDDPAFRQNPSIKADADGWVTIVKRHPMDEGITGAGDLSMVGTTEYSPRELVRASNLSDALVEPTDYFLNSDKENRHIFSGAGKTPQGNASASYKTRVQEAAVVAQVQAPWSDFDRVRKSKPKTELDPVTGEMRPVLEEDPATGEMVPVAEDHLVEPKSRQPYTAIGNFLLGKLKLTEENAEGVAVAAQAAYRLGLKEYGIAAKLAHMLNEARAKAADMAKAGSEEDVVVEQRNVELLDLPLADTIRYSMVDPDTRKTPSRKTAANIIRRLTGIRDDSDARVLEKYAVVLHTRLVSGDLAAGAPKLFTLVSTLGKAAQKAEIDRGIRLRESRNISLDAPMEEGSPNSLADAFDLAAGDTYAHLYSQIDADNQTELLNTITKDQDIYDLLYGIIDGTSKKFRVPVDLPLDADPATLVDCAAAMLQSGDTAVKREVTGRLAKSPEGRKLAAKLIDNGWLPDSAEGALNPEKAKELPAATREGIIRSFIERTTEPQPAEPESERRDYRQLAQLAKMTPESMRTRVDSLTPDEAEILRQADADDEFRRAYTDALNRKAKALTMEMIRKGYNIDPKMLADAAKATTSGTANYAAARRTVGGRANKLFSRSADTVRTAESARAANHAALKALGLAAGQPESVLEALRRIALNGPEHLRPIAKMLGGHPELVRQVRFSIADFDNVRHAGAFHPESNLVMLNMSGHNGRGLADVLVHEYLHAATHAMLESNTPRARAATARIEALRKLTAAQAERMGLKGTQLEAALSSNHEFLTYTLTSPEFQSIVKAATPEGQRSLLRRIVEAVLKLFGFDNSKAHADALETVFDFAQQAAGELTYSINSERIGARRAAAVAEGMRELYSASHDEFLLDMYGPDYLKEWSAEPKNELPTKDGWLDRNGKFYPVDRAGASTATFAFGGHQESIIPILQEHHAAELPALLKSRGLTDLNEATESEAYDIAKALGYARIVDGGDAIYVEATGTLTGKQVKALKAAGQADGREVLRDLGPNRVHPTATIFSPHTKDLYAPSEEALTGVGSKPMQVEPAFHAAVPEGITAVHDPDLFGDAAVSRLAPNEIRFNADRIAARVAGMPEAAAKAVIQSIVNHEVGHLAVFRTVTPEQVEAVARELGPDELQRIAEDYYSATGLSKGAVRDLIDAKRASGELTDSDIADEWLRMRVTEAATGTTSEATIRRIANSNTLTGVIRQALQAFIDAIRHAFASKPTAETAAMISRATRSYRRIAAARGETITEGARPEGGFGDTDAFFSALSGAPQGDRVLYALPVYSTAKGRAEAILEKLRLYNLPTVLRNVMDLRMGTINQISAIGAHFLKQFPALRDAALKDGVSIDDIRDTLGSTAPPLDNAKLKEIDDKVEAMKAADPNATPEALDAYREALKSSARDEFSTAFRKRQQAAEANIRAAGHGRLVDHIVALRNDVNNFKGEIGMDASNDVYLTRSYRFFHTAGWALAATKGGEITIDGQKVDFDKLRELAADSYHDEADNELFTLGRPYTQDDVARRALGKLDNYLAKLQEMTHTSDLKEIESIRKDLNRYKPKKDINENFRELLGEIKDPLANAINTLVRVGTLAANDKFRRRFADTAVDAGLASPLPQDGYVQVYPAGQTNSVGAMAGLYFDPRVAAVLQETYGTGRFGLESASTQLVNSLGRTISAISGVAVQMKTQFGIGYWPRNAIGGYILGAAQGIFLNPFSKTGRKSIHEAFHGAFARLGTESAQREEILKLIGLNIINDQSQGRVVQDLLRGQIGRPEYDLLELVAAVDEARATKDAGGAMARLQQKGWFKGSVGKLLAGYGSVTDAMAALDGGIDAAFKVNAYYYELAELRKHHGNSKTDAELESEAARKVKLTFAGHSQVVDSVKSFNKSPLATAVLPFARWKSEVFRTMLNTVPLAVEEIRAGGSMSVRGVRRLAGFGAVFTVLPVVIGAVASATFRALAGDDEDAKRVLTDEEKSALREALPDWQKGHSLYSQVLKGNRVQYIDMTYILPHSQLTDLGAIMSEGLRTGKGIDSGRLSEYVVKELIGAQIAANAANELLSNKDAFDQPIWLETDSPAVKMARMLRHYAKGALVPSALAKGMDVGREGNPLVKEQVLGELIGVRPRSLTFTEIERRGFRNLKKLQDESVSILGELASGRHASQDDVDAVIDRHQDSMNEAQRRMSKFMSSMLSLGSDPASVFSSAKAYRFSDDTIKSAYNGYRIAWRPNERWNQKAYQSALQGGEQDPAEKIRMIQQSVARKPDQYWVADGVNP